MMKLFLPLLMLLLMASVAGAVSFSQPNSNYRFENNGDDTFGRNSLTVSGSPAYPTDRVEGATSAKDAGSTYFYTTGMNSTSDFSFALWYNFTTAPTGTGCADYGNGVIMNRKAVSGAGYQMLMTYINGSNWMLCFWSGDGTTNQNSIVNIGSSPIGTGWHLITGTKYGVGDGHIYLYYDLNKTGNTTMAAGGSQTGDFAIHTDSWALGTNNGYGQIDNLSLWFGYKLSWTDVTGLYNAVWGVPSSAPTFSTVNNNATALSTTGKVVNWTTTISSTVGLHSCWFSHNDSGSFVNKTVVRCTSPFVLSDNVTITASPLKNVCGYFGANDTAGAVALSSQSCFTVADVTMPTFTNAVNNASAAAINSQVNWSVNLADNAQLGFFTFSFNSSGSFVNDSAVAISGTSRAANVTKSVSVVPNKNICGRFYFNDSSGNQNMSQSCFTTPNLILLNFSAIDRRNGSLVSSFSVSLNGSLNYSGNSSSNFVLLTVVPSSYGVNVSSASLGYAYFARDYSVASNVSVNLPNFTIAYKPVYVLETELASFSISSSLLDDSQFSGLQLIYNGTAQTTTRTVDGGVVWYNSTVLVPSTPAFVAAVPFTWNYTFGGVLRSIESYNLSVADIVFWNCSGQAGNLTLNVSFHDEDNPNSLLVARLQAEFFIYVHGREGVINATFDLSGSSSYAFCLWPNNATVQTDAYFQDYVTDGLTHRHYLTDATLTNSTSYVQVFNFPSNKTGLSDLKGVVRDASNYQYFQNIIVSLQRHYLGEGVWRTVQMDKTGDFGLITFDIYEDSTDYRLIFKNENNVILKETSTLKFKCTDGLCELTFPISNATSAVASANPLILTSFNNDTGILTTSWNDLTGLTQIFRVKITKETMIESLTLCDSSVASSSGSITCNVSSYTGTAFVQVFVTSPSETETEYSEWIDIGGPRLSGVVDVRNGSLWSAGIMIMIVGFALWNPLAAVIAAVIGIIVIALMGMLSAVTVGMAIVFAVLGTVVGILIRKGRG